MPNEVIQEVITELDKVKILIHKLKSFDKDYNLGVSDSMKIVNEQIEELRKKIIE